MKRLILASSSPRRRDLLNQLGLRFDVEPAEIDETAFTSQPAARLVRALSRKKAAAVASRHKNAIIIAADTVVELDGSVLGKPHGRTEAKTMLRSLSGKHHTVITGFTIIDSDTQRTLTRTVKTKVYVKALKRNDIDAYVETGEPLDKAGGYGIQGSGSILIKKIVGDYSNVVGLPLSEIADSLTEFGIDVWKTQMPAAKRAAFSPAKKPVEKAA